MNRKEKNGVKALPFSRLREQCGKKNNACKLVRIEQSFFYNGRCQLRKEDS